MFNKKMIKNADIPMVSHKIKNFRHAQGTSVRSIASKLHVSESNIQDIEQGKISDVSLLIKEAKKLGIGNTHLQRIFQNNQIISKSNDTLQQCLLRQGILQGLKPLDLARKVGYKKNLPSSQYLKENLSTFCHIAHILGENNNQILLVLKQHNINLYGNDFHTYVKRNCILRNLSLSQLAKYSGVQYPTLYYNYKHNNNHVNPKLITKVQNVFSHDISTQFKLQQKNYKKFMRLLHQRNYKNISTFSKAVRINYPQIKQLALGGCHVSYRILYQISNALKTTSLHLIHMQHLTNPEPSPFRQLLASKHIFTQSELARRSHLSSASINHIITRHTKMTMKTLQKLAKALDISIAKLKLILPSTVLNHDDLALHELTNSHDQKSPVTSSKNDKQNTNVKLSNLFKNTKDMNKEIDRDYHNELKYISSAAKRPISLKSPEQMTQINHMINAAISNYERQHNSPILSNQDILFQKLYSACKKNTVMKQLVLNVTKLSTSNAQLILNLVNNLVHTGKVKK